MKVDCYLTPENTMFTEGLTYKARRINENCIEITDNLGYVRVATRQHRPGRMSEHYVFCVVDGPFSDFNKARFNILCE